MATKALSEYLYSADDYQSLLETLRARIRELEALLRDINTSGDIAYIRTAIGSALSDTTHATQS
jgi:prefoldin subunit 5